VIAMAGARARVCASGGSSCGVFQLAHLRVTGLRNQARDLRGCAPFRGQSDKVLRFGVKASRQVMKGRGDGWSDVEER
jgi:hypothetical protein